MEVSTIDFFEAVKEVSQGNGAAAKIITDYVEQTKQTNYTTLKDVFLTKDDKVELVKEIHEVRNTIDINFKWSVGMFISVLITLFVLLFKAYH